MHPPVIVVSISVYRKQAEWKYMTDMSREINIALEEIRQKYGNRNAILIQAIPIKRWFDGGWDRYRLIVELD